MAKEEVVVADFDTIGDRADVERARAVLGAAKPARIDMRQPAPV